MGAPPPSGPAASPGSASASSNSSSNKKSSSRRNAWGNLSYADLITQAIQSSPEGRLTLSQVYEWMVQNIPYFKDKGDSNSSAGWKVRRRAAFLEGTEFHNYGLGPTLLLARFLQQPHTECCLKSFWPTVAFRRVPFDVRLCHFFRVGIRLSIIGKIDEVRRNSFLYFCSDKNTLTWLSDTFLG